MLQLVERHEGVVVAALPEDVDFHTGPAVRSAGEALLTDDCRCLVLDASGVQSLDSSGITVILGFWRRLDRTGGSLILATPDEHVQARLVMLGLDTVLTLTRSLREALAAARRPSPSNVAAAPERELQAEAG